MTTPFLVARFVFFALIIYLNVILLVFSTWHVNATSRAGISLPAAVGFLILGCCTVFLFVLVALAELVCARARTAQVKFECGWTGVASIFHIGATIGLTVNGPIIMCQSSTNCFTLLAYFFALTIAALMHTQVCPNIWSLSIYSAPWFEGVQGRFIPRPSENTLPLYTTRSKPSVDSVYILRHPPHRKQSDEELPKWAKSSNQGVKRGVDSPFMTRGESGSSTRSSAPMAVSTPIPQAPIIPQRPQLTGERQGSRFLELIRESRIISRPGGQVEYGMTSPTNDSPFPTHVADHDKPIPLPHLSQWIRANSSSSFSSGETSLHRIPLASP